MSVFRSGGQIFHTEGARTVWSTTRRPVLLLPAQKVTIPSLDLSWPHLTTANAYGYSAISSGGFTSYSAASFITMVPQEWDTGLLPIATIPAGCNYFQVDVNFNRIATPTGYMGTTIPMLLPAGQWQTLDGASATAERIGPFARIFRFERVGTTIYLRLKQSVRNAGEVVPWLSGNNPTNGAGGQRNGWTWGGTNGNLGHIYSQRGTTFSAFGNRGQSGMAPIDDNTNLASIWRGAVIITPGYIKA